MCDHFNTLGDWNDDGAWYCRACHRFIRWGGDDAREKLEQTIDDREDLRAITTHNEE